MSKSWNRMETWLALIALGIGALLTLIFGLPMYMSATATRLHPDTEQVSSVVHADPSQRWAAAVERARQVMRAGLTEQNVPGLSVAVGVAGEIVWAEGFGWADLENRVPVTPETRFRIGTASKVLTSAAVGLLLEKDQLKLDEEIQTYVPEFPTQQWPVTLRHLMGHTSGLRNDGGDESPLYSQSCERPVDALQHFVEGPLLSDGRLLFEPGTRYRYSNFGWIVVSAAVEAAGGEPFVTFMREQVFEPLRMHDTRADSAAKPILNAATFYFPRYGGDPRYGLHLMRPLDYSCYAGAAAFLSTPSDLVRFGLAINDGKLLQPATVQLLQAAQRLPSGEDTGYGLGWDLETVTLAGEQTQVAGHDGDTLGGPVVSLMTFRERGIAVAVMSNISYTETPSLALKVAEAFADSGEPRE